MIQSKKFKLVLLLSFLFIFTVMAGMWIQADNAVCMGVPLIGPEALNAYERSLDRLADQFLFSDQKAAMDLATKTLYISQPASALNYTDLLGNLQMDSSEDKCQLYFVKDDAMMNIPNSIADNIPLTLLVLGDVAYEQWNVVITTLPVLRLEGEVFSVNEEGRDVLRGDFVLWTGSDPGVNAQTTTVSDVEWHIRGASSAAFDKKSYKLSLKKDEKNNDCDLLGLGADDDWILNALRVDSTNLREKFAMDMWNGYFASESWNDSMSVAEYVEVFINDEYDGLYLLQRRIDSKYLQLNQETDILLKGYNTWTPSSIQKAYEIVDSPYTSEETYQIIEESLYNLQMQRMDAQNLIDVSIFLNYLEAVDNVGYKNTFYVLHASGETFRLSFVPWDTDWSLGYRYPLTDLTGPINRQEYTEMLKTYPEVHQVAAERWWQIRDTVFSEKTIMTLLDSNLCVIRDSGAFQREINRWGLWNENDTVEKLYALCFDRLYLLDEYYNNECAPG